jgi:hypothetical protein
MWYNHVLRWFHKAAPFDDDFLNKGQSWGDCRKQKVFPEQWNVVKITGGAVAGHQYGKLSEPFSGHFEEQEYYEVTTLNDAAEEQEHEIEGKYLAQIEMRELPFVTTIHVLNSLVLKLSRIQSAESVYRGAQGGVLPKDFWVSFFLLHFAFLRDESSCFWSNFHA